MNPRILASAAALGGAALVAAGCSVDVELDRSGETVTETYEVGDFERVSIDAAWDADIQVGPETSVEVQVDEEILDEVDIKVEGDTLVVDLESGLFSISGDLDIHITTPTLVGVEVNGATRLDIEDLDTERFEVDVSGASQVTADGTVGELIVNADGASQLDFDKVIADKAEIDANGASQIQVTGADEVRGELDGASQLDVSPDADVEVDADGASSIDS